MFVDLIGDHNVNWSIILPQHKDHLREAIEALRRGHEGDKDPSPVEAEYYQRLTRAAYGNFALEYHSDTQQKTSLDELLDKFISLLTDEDEDGIVLDVGCGPGRDLSKIRSRVQCAIGIDIALAMLHLARDISLAQVVQMDMRRLGFSEKSVKGIWCAASLLHLRREEIPEVLREFWRVLQPKGILFLSVKQGTGTKLIYRPKTGGLPRLFTYFTREEIVNYLGQAEFEVDEITRNLIYRDKIGWDVWLNVIAHKIPEETINV